MADDINTINTSSGKADGLNKCPKCGSTEISTQPGTGRLICNYCRNVFDPPAPVGSPLGTGAAAPPPTGIPVLTSEQTGTHEVRGSGAADIDASVDTVVTITCQGCGAEVVVDTDETMTARCHWCRQLLSVENQIPNGAVPDILLPFMLSKEQASKLIEGFVSKRKFFANKTFKAEFTTENIRGVYLPYFVIDATTHGTFKGTAGHVFRKYTRGTGNQREFYYDIDYYDIGRDFDLLVDGLTIEGNSKRRNVDIFANTNNVINSIMPFDVENAIAYNGNYLKGFTSERRDTNIDDLRGLAQLQMSDVARVQANGTATTYDAGIKWEEQDLSVKNSLWRSAYFPVWLYSYMETQKNGKKLLHYVAVNARTGETMGSVPVSKRRLFIVAAIIEIIAIPIAILVIVAGILS